MGVRSAFDHAATLSAIVDRSLDGEVFEALDRYVGLLLGPGVDRGLIGPRETERVWARHILNCAALSPLVPQHASVADIGSGAGLPGVVLALVRPDLRITLVEPLLRRAEFLLDVVAQLGLQDSTRVERARAEQHHSSQYDSPYDPLHDPPYDVVMARAVAPLGRLARWTLPLVRPGGVLLAVKGRRALSEVAMYRAELTRLGATAVRVTELGVGVLAVPTTVVVVRKQ